MFKFWSAIRLEGQICITVPNFIEIGQTVAEVSHLTIFKMAAICHLGFLKVWFFEQLVSCGGLICVIVQNFVKIGQTVCEMSRFFDFSRWPPSAIWVLKFLNFSFPIRLRGLICIIIPNFIKIGQTAAEIPHLTFFKMAAVRHLGFSKIDFLNILYGWEDQCAAACKILYKLV